MERGLGTVIHQIGGWAGRYFGTCGVIFAIGSSMGCGPLNHGVTSWIDGAVTNPSTIGNDFLNTQILANGPAQADGVSPLVVVIQLKNSNNTPIVNYTPTYQVSNDSGLIMSTCTDLAGLNRSSSCDKIWAKKGLGHGKKEIHT